MRSRLRSLARHGRPEERDDEEDDGWGEDGEDDEELTARTAAVLRVALEELSEQTWQDVAALGDTPLRRGEGRVLGSLPPITFHQDQQWRRQMARCFDDLAADLADSDTVRPPSSKKYQWQDTRAYRGYNWVAQASTYTHSEWDGHGRLGIFLCPSPLSFLLASPRQVASQRQRRIAPEVYDGLRRWITTRDANNGIHRPERYISREALERHRSFIADMTYEEFTARTEGFDSTEAREWEHRLRVALEVERLIGKLGVGELMPYQVTG